MDMKTAISLPDPLFRSAEQLAARLGISRSELYCRAIRDLLAHHDDAAITQQLDAVYGSPDNNTGLEPGLAAMQVRAIRGRSKK